MAKDYLAVMASSAPIERQFSIFGNIITKNRNRIEEGIGRKLMCLRNWKVPELSVSLQYRAALLFLLLYILTLTGVIDDSSV
jgi:hAT family protein